MFVAARRPHLRSEKAISRFGHVKIDPQYISPGDVFCRVVDLCERLRLMS